MNELRIYGQSDDLIEIEGYKNGDRVFFEELDCWNQTPAYIPVTDGDYHLSVMIHYGNDGIWRVAHSMLADGAELPEGWKLETRRGHDYSMMLVIKAEGLKLGKCKFEQPLD